MTEEKIYEPREAPRVARIAVRGVDYAVTEWGDKDAPLIIFLHGFADAGATFQFVVDEFRHDWRVIAPDWRGFGRTQPDTGAFWFPDYLADLDGLLSHYSADSPVRLVGHSMGGNIAGLYAGVFPERVAALVNLEGFGLPDSAPSDAPRRYREWVERGRQLPQATVRENFTMLAEVIRRRSPRMSRPQAEFVARQWAEDVGNAGVRLRHHPAHKLPNPVLYRLAEVEACWREVTADVLLVTGRDSDFAPPENLPFPRCQTEWIDDSGHMLHFEQPAVLARLIEEFLLKPTT
jgi:pimeloyl-ACP methyl ester carboxylesterase